MPGDAVFINRLVAAGSADHLLTTENRYVLQFKSPFGTHTSFSCGKAQFMEIMNKYGLTPEWKYWETQTKLKKDGTTYDKLIEVSSDTEKKPKVEE